MNLLEERYRRVLRLLPAAYRAEREDEMVAAFLDGAGDAADDDTARPDWSEVASVAALAIRLRLGGADAPPRAYALGEGVRLTARLGLVLHAVLSCVALGLLLRPYGVLGLRPAAGFAKTLGPPGSAERLGQLAGGAVVVLGIAACVTLFYGRRRHAKVLAVLAAVPAIGRPVIDLATALGAETVRSLEAWESLRTEVPYALLAAVPVLALLAGYHRDAPAPPRPARPAVVAAALGAVLAVALGALTGPGLGTWMWPWIDPGGLFALLLLVIGLAYAGVHVLAPARRTPAWPTALLLLLVPALITRGAALASAAPAETAMLLIQIGTESAAALLFLALGVRTLRGLPAAPSRG